MCPSANVFGLKYKARWAIFQLHIIRDADAPEKLRKRAVSEGLLLVEMLVSRKSACFSSAMPDSGGESG
jgi:hypothetical protein